MGVEFAFTISAVAAVCEFIVKTRTGTGPCEVEAVGRCAECGYAFCASHSSAQFTDLCAKCVADRAAASQRSRADAERAIDEAPARIAAAAAILARSSIAPERRSYKWEEKRLLRTATVEHALEPAWPVGTFTWAQPETQRQGPRSDLRTGVTRSGKIVPMDVAIDGESPLIVSPTGLDSRGTILQVAAAIEDLARRT
ncbi:hypothetical protein [Actinoplanes sp. NPDC026619]|uniref:hypothetical protein n=1 Tax=Actinoplanes sp. NPDC026619 TaxID=3155798 RepID=UPI0033FD5018